MPIYEYGCYDCRKRVDIFWRSFSAAEKGTPKCPRCEGTNIKRLVSKVALLRSEESRLESMADPAKLAALEEEDPKALGKLMRQMGSEMGEDLGQEFDEVMDRLESGQMPEEIEKDMPDMSGGMGDSGAGDDWSG